MDNLKEILEVLRPLIEFAVTAVALPALALVSKKIIDHLKIKDEVEAGKIEIQLNTALHQAAANAIRYAANKAGIPLNQFSAVMINNMDVVADAMDYVRDKNPDTLKKLGVSGEQLRDIILTKIPPH